jgi:hypothetical protein
MQFFKALYGVFIQEKNYGPLEAQSTVTSHESQNEQQKFILSIIRLFLVAADSCAPCHINEVDDNHIRLLGAIFIWIIAQRKSICIHRIALHSKEAFVAESDSDNRRRSSSFYQVIWLQP